MLTFKEFFMGTPEEIAARETIEEIQAKGKTRPNDQMRLNRARGISRRTVLRRGAVLLAGATLAGSLGTFVVPQINERAQEEAFLASLEGRPVEQKVAMVDSFYSKALLSEQRMRSHVLPIWIDHYSQMTGARIMERSDLPNTIRLQDTGILTNGSHGAVVIDWVNEIINPPVIALDHFPSNKMVTHHGEQAPGIVFTRSNTTHELTHFDMEFRKANDLANRLISQNLIKVSHDFDKSIAQGFLLTLGKTSDKKGTAYFGDFDEASTDLITSHTFANSGVRTAFMYDGAIILKVLLDWQNFDMQHFTQLHRASDLEGVIKGLGSRSLGMRKQSQTEENQLSAGCEAIGVFHTGNVEVMESLYPGFKAVLSRNARRRIV